MNFGKENNKTPIRGIDENTFNLSAVSGYILEF
jgi:hypothetical protein